MNKSPGLHAPSKGLKRLKRDNDAKREWSRQLRESLAARRRTLSAARLVPAPPLEILTAKETQKLHVLSAALARARSWLVQEFVEVFHVVEVGGRPPIGGKAGTKDHINAVITHTIHFLGLLRFYLGIKLPFEMERKKFGVGQPWIGAGKGGESGSWAKWTTKHPLYLTASSLSSSSPSSPQTPLPTSTLPLAPPTEPKASFTTTFAMLLYNDCYLAHTQSVEIPLSYVGDELGNLWAVCCSGELGRRSHETTPSLPPPTPSSFPLDFAQVLQATTASPARGRRRVGVVGIGMVRDTLAGMRDDHESVRRPVSSAAADCRRRRVGGGGRGRTSRPVPAEEGHGGLSTVMMEIRGAAVDPEKRMKAIGANQKVREKEMATRSDAFGNELKGFVDGKKLKMTGGAEEAERVRQKRNELALKAMFNASGVGADATGV